MLSVALVGRQRQGKSLLANALVARGGLLPEAPVACTDAVITVSHGKEGWGSLRFDDGTSLEGPWSRLKAMCSVAAEREQCASRVRSARVTVDEPPLERISIVDLPGLDSVDPRHQQLVEEGLANCDAVVLVTRLEQGIGATERELLRRLAQTKLRVLAVIGNVSRHGEADEAEVLATTRSVSTHQRKVLAELLGSSVPYVPWNLRDMAAFGQGALVLRLAHAIGAQRGVASIPTNHVERSS